MADYLKPVKAWCLEVKGEFLPAYCADNEHDVHTECDHHFSEAELENSEGHIVPVTIMDSAQMANVWSLIEMSACPDCRGDGAYYDNHGEVTQCQWCDERKQQIEALRPLCAPQPPRGE